MVKKNLILTVLLFCLLGLGLNAQIEESSPPQDSMANDSLTLITINATEMRYDWDGVVEMDTLLGDVEMRQDSLLMLCDRAYVRDKIYSNAYDNVIIIHEDSLWIFADSLYYDGATKIAKLYGEVILQEGGKNLYTNELTYDINTKIASYTTGGTLIEGQNTIKSRIGYYYSKRKEAKLIGNVTFQDSTKTMYTDSVIYFTEREQLNIISPTTILDDSLHIYCESGIYRLQEEKGILSKNVQVISGDSTTITSSVLHIDQQKRIYTFLINPQISEKNGTAKGDTIIYYEQEEYVDLNGNASYKGASESIDAPKIRYNLKTEGYESIGRAKVINEESLIVADQIKSDTNNTTFLNGNVYIQELTDGITIQSDAATKTEAAMKIYSTEDQPLMQYPMEDDTLLLRADTLTMLTYFENTDSVKKVYNAINDVKLIQGDVLGRANHFIYDKEDSIITMSKHPVLWSDSLQMNGDTIKLYLSNGRITKIDLIGNAFILSPEEGGHMNQIKSDKIINHFAEGAISSSDARGNAEMLYLIRKENKYEGINITKSNTMIFTFDNGEIQSFSTSQQQESNLYEYKAEMEITQYYLVGYEWRISEKPGFKEFILSSAQEK